MGRAAARCRLKPTAITPLAGLVVRCIRFASSSALAACSIAWFHVTCAAAVAAVDCFMVVVWVVALGATAAFAVAGALVAAAVAAQADVGLSADAAVAARIRP